MYKSAVGKVGSKCRKTFWTGKKPVLSCQPKKVSFFCEDNCSFFSSQEETTPRQPATEYGWQNEALKIWVGAKQVLSTRRDRRRREGRFHQSFFSFSSEAVWKAPGKGETTYNNPKKGEDLEVIHPGDDDGI